MALKERIQELLDAGFTRAQLAGAAKLTPAAVTHWMSGGTAELKGPTAAALQALTGYSAAWIATGALPKKLEPKHYTLEAQGGQFEVAKTQQEPATPVAMEIALLFDEIPVQDRIRRTQAYNAATQAILGILEGSSTKSHAKPDSGK